MTMDDEGPEVAELQPLADSLSCPICKGLPTGPVVNTVCGHIGKAHRDRSGRILRGLPCRLPCTTPGGTNPPAPPHGPGQPPVRLFLLQPLPHPFLLQAARSASGCS